jgi:protein-S-isoprenylcysteine O-methyltransferase Ste14
LIRSGPYRFVRHPIYAGLLAALAAGALGSGKVHTLVGFALIAVGLLHKAALEEQFMREQFGEQYARYQHEVKSIIPFVC